MLTATPVRLPRHLLLAYFVAFQWELFPVSGAYDFSLQPAWTLGVHPELPQPLDPPVPLALPRLVRRLGDRDAEPDHLRARGRLRRTTSQALGAPNKLVRKYAYGNAVLPQMTGLALALGVIVGGALVTEIVFGYPGVGIAPPDCDPEPRLLPPPGHLPVHHRRRPDRELHRRHRLRHRRPTNADRAAGTRDRGRPAPTPSRPRAAAPPRSRWSSSRTAAAAARATRSLYFALRNRKLVVGLDRRARLPRARDRRAAG